MEERNSFLTMREELNNMFILLHTIHWMRTRLRFDWAEATVS